MNLRTILILGALSAFGPLAIDFYLPAFRPWRLPLHR
jgi:DHA1 family bicyclomycin/chloramphenicol resistance-like MFS transporter